MFPAAHVPQSAVALYFASQVPHDGPLHWLRHVQLHPVFAFPLTFVACPLQFAAIVHVR
jgi:hypothetical protein